MVHNKHFWKDLIQYALETESNQIKSVLQCLSAFGVNYSFKKFSETSLTCAKFIDRCNYVIKKMRL